MVKLSTEELARRKEARAAAAAARKAARAADPEWIAQRRAKSRLYCAAYKRRKLGIVLAPEEALAESLRHESALLESRKAKAEALAAELEQYEAADYWGRREREILQEATERRLRTLAAEVEKRVAAERKRIASKLERLNSEIDRIEALESALAEKFSRQTKESSDAAPPEDDYDDYSTPLGDIE
ncbi:MAG: hypothetical protein BWY99_01474 [Synergistetes bacterium ADurb.BinA166]|nr:MAG: hypothetical protein BWY99_01474 [Synergistetes bacterium ADurb.BinA166]